MGYAPRLYFQILWQFCLFFLPFISFSQTPFQTLRGTVKDAGNARPLTGASVVLLETNPILGATSDENGDFKIEKVPVGRYRVQVSYVGYKTLTIAEVLVEAGKESVQQVQLRESQEQLQEVVVKASGGGAALHPVSTYSLTVEEQFRFPATFYDPARLAAALAGVTGNNDQENTLSVRGNSPSTIKWRLEGVEIVNPNHTANAGTFSDRPTLSGGGLNILSAQLLASSHFYTGAFPAGIGNAIGGVFDMRLRKGNDRQHEFTAQAGFLGLEAAAEGPLVKRSPGNRPVPTYLFNYRYSFTGLLAALDVDFGGDKISFQDISLNLSFPTKKIGEFTWFFTLGGSKTIFRSPSDSAQVKEHKDQFDIDFKSVMTVIGLTYMLPLGKTSIFRWTSAFSAVDHKRMAWLTGKRFSVEDDYLLEAKPAFSLSLVNKASINTRLEIGLEAFRDQAEILVSYNHPKNEFFRIYAEHGSWIYRPFFILHNQLTPKLELNVGLGTSFFSFNKTASAEPHLSLVCHLSKSSRLNLGWSLLSQLPPFHVYYWENNGSLPYRKLGFMRSHHLVAGFRKKLSESLNFISEAYYQYLFQVPVSNREESTFSMINMSEIFRSIDVRGNEKLRPAGSGRNFGVDFTLQKLLFRSYYFYVTSSLFRSLYTAFDNIERPTRFDNRYIFKFTGGREFFKSKGESVRIKGLSARFTWFGGFRTTPIDLAASEEKGFTVFDESEAFSLKQPDYVRLDLRFYLKWNKAGRNSTLSFDIQNATNRENVAYYYYDTVQKRVVEKKQLGIIPILSYRIEF